MMRSRKVKLGMIVWTATIESRERIPCRVLGYDRWAREWLLESPAHGYAICRRADDMLRATADEARRYATLFPGNQA